MCLLELKPGSVSGQVTCVLIPQVWWELEGPQVPLRPDCLAIVNNFAFLLGGEELGPDGEFHASSKVYRYDPRQNSWLRMADMSVPRLEDPEAPRVVPLTLFSNLKSVEVSCLFFFVNYVNFQVILQILTDSLPPLFE